MEEQDELPIASVLERFESLGGGSDTRGGWAYGCEFGIFQRHRGVEPLGLLRWASIAIEDLTNGIAESFSGFDDVSTLNVTDEFGWDWALI